MPRAENRKKPTGQAGGGMKQGGFQNKSNGSTGSAFENANNKKQALIEKMKKQQAEKSNQE